MFKKFFSRKLIVTLGACLVKLLHPSIPDSILILAGTYVVGQGAVDAVTAGTNVAKEGREAVDAVRAAAKP